MGKLEPDHPRTQEPCLPPEPPPPSPFRAPTSSPSSQSSARSSARPRCPSSTRRPPTRSVARTPRARRRAPASASAPTTTRQTLHRGRQVGQLQLPRFRLIGGEAYCTFCGEFCVLFVDREM